MNELGGMDPAGIYFIRSNVRSSFVREISQIFPRKPRIRSALLRCLRWRYKIR